MDRRKAGKESTLKEIINGLLMVKVPYTRSLQRIEICKLVLINLTTTSNMDSYVAVYYSLSEFEIGPEFRAL